MLVSAYIVKLVTGKWDPSLCMMRNSSFIDEYVGESVSTCLKRHVNHEDDMPSVRGDLAV